MLQKNFIERQNTILVELFLYFLLKKFKNLFYVKKINQFWYF